MIKLDIGSGKKYEDTNDFIGVDAFSDANVKANMWDLPFKDGEVDLIYSSNALEHVSKYAIIPTLREWHRVLKMGGIIDLIVPDLEWSVLWWLDHQNVDWSIDVIFGHQREEGQTHMTGFTEDIMRLYLKMVGGLEVKEVEYVGNSLEDIPLFGILIKEDPNTIVRQRCMRFTIEKTGGLTGWENLPAIDGFYTISFD